MQNVCTDQNIYCQHISLVFSFKKRIIIFLKLWQNVSIGKWSRCFRWSSCWIVKQHLKLSFHQQNWGGLHPTAFVLFWNSQTWQQSTLCPAISQVFRCKSKRGLRFPLVGIVKYLWSGVVWGTYVLSLLTPASAVHRITPQLRRDYSWKHVVSK